MVLGKKSRHSRTSKNSWRVGRGYDFGQSTDTYCASGVSDPAGKADFVQPKSNDDDGLFITAAIFRR